LGSIVRETLSGNFLSYVLGNILRNDFIVVNRVIYYVFIRDVPFLIRFSWKPPQQLVPITQSADLFVICQSMEVPSDCLWVYMRELEGD